MSLYLVIAIVSAVLTLNVYLPVRRVAAGALVSFFSGWLVGELPLHHLALQVGVATAFIAQGALTTADGQIATALMVVSWAGLVHMWRQADAARETFEAALAEAWPDLDGVVIDPIGVRAVSNPGAFRRPGVARIRNLPYAREHGRRGLLDVYKPDGPVEGRPVLLYVHGGGWVVSKKEHQGQPLLYRMAERGWIGVTINYRLGPRATWPDQIVDVKRAIRWIREHIADFGGDPAFIAISGGSAGGHLAALAALTPDEADWQPGFEDADTSIQACVPLYGVYDFTDRFGHWPHRGLQMLLRASVLKRSRKREPEAWDKASPMSHVDGESPPFFVIQGRKDSLVPAAEARRFVELLREASSRPVAYAEVAGAQHAFEVFVSRRTLATVEAIAVFLDKTWQTWREERADAAPEHDEVEAAAVAE